jgi:penicillin V acylase-like amidase (Ntn superfamily)
LGSIAESSIDRSNLIEIIEDGLNSIGIATEKGMVQKAGYAVNRAINDQKSID